MKPKWLAWAGLVLVLIVINTAIVRFERILANGDILLLELAPVDPRALLQGDYMALRYAVTPEVEVAYRAEHASGRDMTRYAVFLRDEAGVGRFLRLQRQAEPQNEHEVALRVRVEAGGVAVAADAWFFPEGQASHYQEARYGELRVGAGGTALLSGLRDSHFAKL